MLDWVRAAAPSYQAFTPLGSEAATKETQLDFHGYDGATSLKAELSGRIHDLNDASTFREARTLLLKLGGPAALRDELVFSGFVDPDNGMLNLVDKPFNIFAHIAAGRIQQPAMSKDQEALGKYASKFHICSNKADNDLHWDSKDPKWIQVASMARRHRFLTTRNMHWQWFNLLVAGLVSPEDGGVSARDALQEVEEMKAAAVHYAKNVGGWSDNVGVFVNVFGHNNVNSLFVHVLDMSEPGPGFALHMHKNCPLDAVLKVLREEVVQSLVTEVPRSVTVLPGRRVSRPAAFFFQGTDGATSLKAEIVARIPVISDASGYREARRLLKEELGGYETIFWELHRSKFIDEETNMLTTGTTPFNVFARIAAGVMTPPGHEAEQVHLGDYSERFMICGNRPENDEHWDSESPEWVGKASMARHHKFLIMKDMHWQWFNALSFGMVPAEKGGVPLKLVVATLELMKAAALTYAANRKDWSEKVGLFFHVFGHNSVNALHLHIVDMAQLGPTFWKLDYKNCPLDAILRVLREELESEKNARASADTDDAASAANTSAANAAASMKETMEAVKEMVTRHSAQMLGGLSSGENSDEFVSGDTLRLNVGGELVDVARGTMMLAPEGSLLREMFTEGTTHSHMICDMEPDPRTGRIFINFPPQSFKRLVNHLRLLDNTNPEDQVGPLVVHRRQRAEIEELAWLLGVGDLIAKVQNGRAAGMPRRTGPRPEIETIEPSAPGWIDRLRGKRDKEYEDQETEETTV